MAQHVLATSGDGNSQDWEELRTSFRPNNVRVLFVGESAPPNGRTFFYAGNSRLFRFWMEAFSDVLDRKWAIADSFLQWFMTNGYYLDDLLLGSVPENKSERKKLRPLAESHLAERIRDIQPNAVVTVMKEISLHVDNAVTQASVHTWQGEVGFPYPGRHYKQSEREAREVIAELKLLRKLDTTIKDRA